MSNGISTANLVVTGFKLQKVNKAIKVPSLDIRMEKKSTA